LGKVHLSGGDGCIIPDIECYTEGWDNDLPKCRKECYAESGNDGNLRKM